MNDILNLLTTTPAGAFLAFVSGVIWGSFFNVCIYRMPREESVVSGRSHCPQCSHLIRWFENLPILSYLWLRGKCSNCGKRISPQYPIVEGLTGIAFLVVFLKFGVSFQFLSYVTLVSSLIIITFIDLEHQIIPDELSLSGIVVGFLFSFLTKDISWKESLGGLFLGGGTFYAIAFLYEKLSKKEGLGGGDIKLLGMLGAWLGYQSVLPIILVSTGLGSVIGIIYMMAAKKGVKTAIPFGPFLAVGAIVYLFFRQEFLNLLFPEFS